MARTEKDFLNTLETYVKITQDRLRDGRIIDAHDELGLIEIMIDQRRREVEGIAPWVTYDPRVTDLDALAEECRVVWEKAITESHTEPKEDFGARMLKKLTE